MFCESTLLDRLTFTNVRALKAPILMSLIGFMTEFNCKFTDAKYIDGTSVASTCTP